MKKPFLSFHLPLILNAVCYLWAGLHLYLALWLFMESFGSTDSFLGRDAAFFLGSLLPAYLCVVLYRFRHSHEESKAGKVLFMNGIVFASLCFLLLILDIVKLSNGTYVSLVQGFPTALFPLSNLLSVVFGMAIGILMALFAKKWAKAVAPSLPEKGKSHVVGNVLLGLFAFVCAFYAGDFLLFPWTIDHDFSNFGWTLWYYLLEILPFLMLVFFERWRYGTNQEKEEDALPLLLIFGGSTLLCVVLLLIGTAVDPIFWTESLTSSLPFDYMKSWPVGPYLLGINALLAPLISFFYFLKSPVRVK